jgi:hypothetical protein
VFPVVTTPHTLKVRPNESSLDDYEAVPISLFGAAMLRGMGWKEGEGVGAKKQGATEIMLPVPRPHGLGLGANRDTTMKPDKRGGHNRRYIKPGAGRVFKQNLALDDAIGSHACSLEENMRVTNAIHLGCSLLLPASTVHSVQTLQANRAKRPSWWQRQVPMGKYGTAWQ